MSPRSLDEQQRRLPLILTVAVFMQMLDATILNTALPVIARDLHASPLNMQMTVIAYALTLALVMPLSGFLADRLGTRNLFLGAVSVFSIGSLLCALSPSLNALIAARVLQGVGGAVMVPVARLMLMRIFDKKQWLTALNAAITPALVAPIVGPVLGGYLVKWASWHWIFLINLPIGALGLWFGMRYLPDFRQPHMKVDTRGYVWFALSAFLLTLGLDWAGQGGGGWVFVLMVSCGIVFLIQYVRHAERKRNALFPLSLFSVRTFRIGLAGNLFSRLGISSLPLLLPLLLQVGFERSPETAGWILVPMAVAGMLAKPVIVWVLHRFGYRRVLSVNTALAGGLMMMLALPDAQTPLWYFLPLLGAIGLINSIQFSAMNTITLANLRTWQNSSGNSLMSVNQQLSISFGMAAGASLLRFSHQQEWMADGDIHLAFRITLIALGAVTVASTLIFRRLRNHDGDNLANRKG